MKIVKGVLVSICESDIVNGEFVDNKINGIGDGCFSDFKSLTKIECKKVKTIGNYSISSNAALTTLSLPVCETIGNHSIRSNAALTTLRIRDKKLLHKCVDGYAFIVEAKKTSKGINIYTGYNLVGLADKKIIKENLFVAEKDAFTAHGETVKKAIQDLQFKIVSEKLKKDPIKPNTKFTVKYYRTLTGACDSGCRSWMQNNKIPYKIDGRDTVELKPILAKDLLPILEKTNAYGLEMFKSLITF
jgi:hypothetical protein